MKKFLFLFLAVFGLSVCTTTARAQSVKDKNLVNLGIGIGTFGLSGSGGIPIVASFEHGFTDAIGGGGFVSFVKRKFYSDYTYTYYVVGAKGSYHFNEAFNAENEKVDVYGGVSLFYRGFKLNYKNGEGSDFYKSSGGNIGIGIHVAGRYMFNDAAGAFAELGLGVSPLLLGVTFRF